MNKEYDAIWDTAVEWSLYVSEGHCLGVFKCFLKTWEVGWITAIGAEVIF